MSDVNANINIDINSSQAIAGLRNLEAQINRFQRTVTNANAAGVSSLNKGLVDSINATNLFNSRMVDATSSSKRFSDALDKGKLSLGQYVSHAASQMPGMSRVFKREFDTIEQVAKTRVRAINSQYIALGKTVDGVTRAIKSTPTGIADGYGGNLAVTAQRQQMLNKLIDDGSTKLLNWGKNTQWAGRQLMVGFSLPLAALGTVASQTFMEIDKAGLALRRVYGDLSTTTEEINANVDAIKTLGAEYTKYGIALSDTIAISGRAAATGATNEKLLAQTEQTLRFATLGQIDYNTALDSTIALQTAFGVSNEDLAKKIDFLNAVENQTILTIEDMSLAIPRVATVIKGLGGDVEDLAVMMTAMREGGVSAENAANALKSGLASLINPTKRATESLSSMGINIQKIISNNKGDLMGLIKDFANATNTLDDFSRQQVFEQVFGKYQYARMSALFTNITRDSGQAARAMELAGRSAQDLAAISKKELDAISDTTTVKFQAAMEQLKISIAPLGEAFLKGITPIVELVTKVAEAFNNLPDGVKNSIAVITGLVGGLGPILLMTIGLVGNGIANLVKAFQFFRKTLSRLKGDASAFQYMATAELEALVATERLEGGAIQLTRSLNLQKNAVDALTTSYTRFAQAAGIAGGAMSNVAGRPVPGGRPLPPPVRRNRGGSIPYFSDGGSSTVPGVGNTDTVPAMLTPGEFVVNKQSTRENLPLLHAINDGQQVQYRNNGGMIPGVQYFNRRMPQRVVRRSPLDPFTAVLGGIRPGGEKRTSSPERFSYIGSSYATTYRTNAEQYLRKKIEGWDQIPEHIRENMLMGDTSHKIEREIKGQKAWYEPELFGAFGGENRAIRYIFGEAGKPGIGGKLIQIANDGRLNKSEQMFLTRFLKGIHPTSRSEIKALRKMLRNMEMYISKNEEDPYVIKYKNSATYKNKWDKVLYHLAGARLQKRFGGTKVIPITRENLKTVPRRNEGGIIPGVQRLMSGSIVRRPNQSRLQVAKTAKGKELDDILYSRNSKGKLDIDAQTLFEIVRRKDLDEKQLSNIKKYFGKRIKTGIFGDFVDNQNGRKTRVSDSQLSTWRKIAKVLEDKGHRVFNKGGMIPGVQYKSKGGPLRFHQLSLLEQYLPHTEKYNSEVYRLRSGILRPGAMKINASGYLSMIRSVDRYIPGFDKLSYDEQIELLTGIREGRINFPIGQQDPWGGLVKAEPWVIELLASEEGQSRTLMSMLGRASLHSIRTTGQLPQASEDLSVHSGRIVQNLAKLGIIRDPRTPDSHPNWINQPSDLLDGITIDPSAQRQLSQAEEMQGLEFIRAIFKKGMSQSRAKSAELDLSDILEEFLKEQSLRSRIIGANKGGMIPGVQNFISGGQIQRLMRGLKPGQLERYLRQNNQFDDLTEEQLQQVLSFDRGTASSQPSMPSITSWEWAGNPKLVDETNMSSRPYRGRNSNLKGDPVPYSEQELRDIFTKIYMNNPSDYLKIMKKWIESTVKRRGDHFLSNEIYQEYLSARQYAWWGDNLFKNKGGMIPGVQYFGAPGAAGGRVFRQFREGFDWESAISKTKSDSRLRRLFFPSENEQEYQEIFNTMYDPYLRVTSGTAKPENSDPYSGVIQLIRKGDLSEGEVDFITRFLFHSVTQDLPRVERTPTETRYNARTPGQELRDAFIKRQPGKEKEFSHGRQNVESIIEIVSFLKSFPQDHLTAVLIAKGFKDFLGYDDPKLIRAMYALMANKGGIIPRIQKFLNGGEVFGQMLGIGGPTYDSPTSSTPIVPGVGNTDTVPAMLTPGEFVINKQATSENLPLLNAINNGGVIGANKGGMIPGVQYFAANMAQRIALPLSGLDKSTGRQIRKLLIEYSKKQKLVNSAEQIASGSLADEVGRILNVDTGEFRGASNVQAATLNVTKKDRESERLLLSRLGLTPNKGEIVAYHTGPEIPNHTLLPDPVNTEGNLQNMLGLGTYFTQRRSVSSSYAGVGPSGTTSASGVKGSKMTQYATKVKKKDFLNVESLLTSRRQIALARRIHAEAEKYYFSIYGTRANIPFEQVMENARKMDDIRINIFKLYRPKSSTLSPQDIEYNAQMAWVEGVRKGTGKKGIAHIGGSNMGGGENPHQVIISYDSIPIKETLRAAEKGLLHTMLNPNLPIGMKGREYADMLADQQWRLQARIDRLKQQYERGRKLRIQQEEYERDLAQRVAAKTPEKSIWDTDGWNKGGFIPKLFANNGVEVPGIGNTDTVPAMLTPGEFVVNKQSTQANLPLLHAINDGIRMNRGGQIPGVQYFGTPGNPGGQVEGEDPRLKPVSGHTTFPKQVPQAELAELLQRSKVSQVERMLFEEANKLNKLSAKTFTNAIVSIPNIANEQQMTGRQYKAMLSTSQGSEKMMNPYIRELNKMFEKLGVTFPEALKDSMRGLGKDIGSQLSEKFPNQRIFDKTFYKVFNENIDKVMANQSDDVKDVINRFRQEQTVARFSVTEADDILKQRFRERYTEYEKTLTEEQKQKTRQTRIISKLLEGDETNYKSGRQNIGALVNKYESQRGTGNWDDPGLPPRGTSITPTQGQERQERITGRSGKEILRELRSVSRLMATQMAESKASVITAQEELENFRRLPLSLRGSVGDYEEGIAKRQRDLDEAKKQRQEATRRFNELQKERREQKARDNEIARGRRLLNEPFNQRARELAASRVPESENLTNKERGRAIAREMSAARATIKAENDAVRKAIAARALEIKTENKGMTHGEAVQRARLERQSSMNMGDQNAGQDAIAPKVKKPGLLQRMQGGIGAGSMGVSMALGMGSMLPMMKQDEEGKFLGMDSGNAMMGMMGGSMLVGMIPMLGKFAGPAAIALAAIAAVGTGFFLFRKSLDEAATAAAKFGSNVGGTANALGTMSKVIGVADPLENRKLQQISVLPKDQEQFAQYMQMFQEESGQKFISNLNKSFGEDKFNKLSDYIRNAVAAGMMTVSEGQLFAKAVGAQVGDNLLGTRVAASIAGQDTGSDALLALARKREAAVEEQGMYKEFENTPISTDNLNSANAAFVISAGTEIMKAYNAAVAKAEEEYTKGTISWENLIKTVDEASAATKTWSDNVSRATLASDDLGATTKGVENSLIASGAVTQEQLDAIKGAGGSITLGANAFDIGSADVFSGEGMFAKATSAITPLGMGYGFDWVSEKLGLTKKGLFSGEGGLTSGSYADFYAQNLVQQGQLQEGTKEYDQAIADAKKAQAAVYKMTGANTGVARGTMGAGTDYLQAAKLQYIESQGGTQQAIEQANALEQEILVNPMGNAAQAFIKLGMNADSFSQAITAANSDILFSSEALSKRFLDISANIKVPGFQEMFRSYVAGGVDEADREKRLNEIGGIGQGLSPTSRAEAQSRYLSTKTLAQKYYDPNTVDSLMNTAKSAGLFSNTKNKQVKLQDYVGGKTQGGYSGIPASDRTITTQEFDSRDVLRFEKAIGAAGEAGVTKQVINYSIRISGEEKKNPSAVLEDLTEKFKDLASLDTQILTALNVKIDENGNPIDGEDVERLGGQSEALSRGWNMLGALNPNINIQMAASAVLLDGEGNAITDPVAVAKNIMALNKAFSQLTKAKTKEAKLSAQIQIATLYLGEKAGTGEGKVDPAKVVEDARKTLAQIGKDLDKLPPTTVSQIIQLGTTFQIQNADLIENIANINSAISKTKDDEELRRLISARNRMVSQLEGAQKDTEAGQLGLAIGGGGGGGGGGGAESALQSFEKGILEQAKMWLDAGATLDQLNKAKGIFAGKIKEGQGIFDKLKNIKGILPRQLEQIIGMGPKGASDFIKKYIKDGKLTKAGKGLLNVEAAYNRKSYLEGLRLTPTTASLDKVRTNLEERTVDNRKVESDIVEKIMNDQYAIEVMQYGSNKEQEELIRILRRRRTEEEIIATKTEEILKANEKTQKVLDDQIKKQEDIVEGIQDQIDELEKKNDADQWAIRNKSREKELIDRQIESLERANEMDRRRIETLQRQDELRNREADALSHELEAMSDLENKIRETYQERIDALDKVTQLNDHILEQERQRLGLSQALSQGDIYAATAAAQEMRQTQAGFAQQQLRSGLEQGMENAVSGLRTSEGLTREQAEARIKTIKDQSYQTSLLVRDIEDAIYARNQEMIPLKDQQYQIDLQIRDLADQIFERETTIYNIRTSQLDPAMKILESLNDEKTAAQEITDETISQIEATADLYKNTDQLAQKVDNIAAAWHEVNKQIVDANIAAANAVQALGEEPKPKRGETDKEFATRVTNWQNERNAIRARRDKAVSDALAKGKAATASYASATPASATPASTENFYGGIRTYGNGGKIKKYAAGNVVGSGSRDSVNAMLTPGEFVVRKAMVGKYGIPMLNAINQGAFSMPKYNVSESTAGNVSVKTQNTSNIISPMYNNYSVNVSVSNTNASADEIANRTITKIKQMQNMQIRSGRGY